MSKKKNLLLFSFLATAAGITIHLINNSIEEDALNNKHLLKSTDNNYYSWKLGKIYYEKHGEGSPLLLIHDLNSCSSSYEWNKLVHFLSKTNTVYVLDLLGCGRSEKPNMLYTSFIYTEMIASFIKDVMKEKTNIIVTGNSCPFVSMLASKEKDLVDQIIMINPVDLETFSQVPSLKDKILQTFITLPVIGTFVYNMYIRKTRITSVFHNFYFEDPTKITSDDIDAYYKAPHLKNTGSKYLFSSIISGYIKQNIYHCLKQTNALISILYSDCFENNDSIITDYQKAIPDAECIKIKNAKYLPQLEVPETVEEKIEEILGL